MAGKNNNQNRYSLQRLCQQVAQTLNLVLSGEFGDERLQSLQVMSVDPAPNASQLCVTVQTDEQCDRETKQEILGCLSAVTGRLRHEVAGTINRKRTPQLFFRVINPPHFERID